MKPELRFNKNYRNPFIFLFFTALVPGYCNAISQVPSPPDSLNRFYFKIPVASVAKISLSNTGLTFGSPSQLISASPDKNDRTVLFLDSLKIRASKTLITRKLYELVIIPGKPTGSKEISGARDDNYQEFSERTIRNIEIQRLNVFGTNINQPSASQPNNLEKFLNSTHSNTNEAIVRKNLIFAEGDTLSPLTLSDNERLLRRLPFIDDARIVVVPVSETQVDVIVMTKDIYSLGAKIESASFSKGSVSVFERNIFGMGHELGFEVPYDSKNSDSPGFGAHYLINNFKKTFIDLNLYYLYGIEEKTYGFDLGRKFVTSSTKYAGGISVREMFTVDDLDTMAQPAQVKYNLQDYWLSRSFLVDEASVSRFFIGARYINNNVFSHPFILPESFHRLQRYKMFLGSVSFSVQKFYKTSLVYGYGRTEDIPHGALFNLTFGKEISEFKERSYLGVGLSVGETLKNLGYFYSSASVATFLSHGNTEQGMLSLRTNYISNLLYIGNYRVRNFANIEYTRGFDRYSDESLIFNRNNGFSGFRNNTVSGAQRLSASLESVIFSPVNFYGFRFALFGFADLSFLFGTNEFVGSGDLLSSVGIGVRIRNDNLVLNTLQIRLGFFPNLPAHSSVSHLIISGVQLMKPYNFEPGPPSLLPYR